MKIAGVIGNGLAGLVLLSGCNGVSGVCPLYPIPSASVLGKIESLKSVEVDEWMRKQYKLNNKLKVCNGKR